MRLFAALHIPEEVRENLAGVQESLRAAIPNVRWVPPENFHVTLKFIGQASSDQLNAITLELHNVQAKNTVAAKFCGLGFSWKAKRGGVLWSTLEVSEGLKTLAERINQRLDSLKFPAEKRDFLPHLTLARFKESNIVPAIRRAIEQYASHDFGSMNAEEFHLVESKTGPGGSRYTTLATFAFEMSRAE